MARPVRRRRWLRLAGWPIPIRGKSQCVIGQWALPPIGVGWLIGGLASHGKELWVVGQLALTPNGIGGNYGPVTGGEAMGD